VSSVGTLFAIDTDRMRRVPITPHPPSYIVQDSVLPIPEPCPVIFWGVITPEQPYLQHHMAFPSGRTWVTKFDPSHVYWPSQKDPYFEWFLSSFPNYSTFLHRYPNEDWLSHNNRLHDQYRLMYPKFRKEATKMRKSSLDRGIPPMEVEFHMGNYLYCVSSSVVYYSLLDVKFHRYFYQHLIDDPLDKFDTHWFLLDFHLNVGNMDKFLDSHRDVDHVPNWSIDAWWFHQQIPGYDLRWYDIDQLIWMALVARHPELFLFPSVPIQRFIWLRWHCAITSTLADENP
jgi:hypothetical protein